VFAAVEPTLPHMFTSDGAVLAQIPHAWWFFVALQPVAGVVFALDGCCSARVTRPFCADRR
jgi:MATE family, multidrug efflux pump